MPDMYVFYLLLQALQLAWLIGLTLATWLRKPGLDAEAAAEKIQTEFDQQLKLYRTETQRELREQLLKINAIETHMEHMPSKEELAELKGSVNTIAERTLGMSGALDELRKSQRRVEEYLLNNKG